MSYDVILFDPDLVPTDDDAFSTWADTLFTRDDDPSFTPGAQSAAITRLHDDAREVFPEDGDSDRGVSATKYYCDFDHLEITFADADAQAASQWIQDYAANHSLGIYDVDSTGKVTLPDPDSQPPMSKGASQSG